jgi:ABC-type transport system involved in multi-copper enzyme maturation permease subunit
MKGLLAADLIKLRSVRTTWVFVLIVAIICALLAGVGAALDNTLNDSDSQNTLFSTGTQVVILLMICFGIVGSAGEYRHGTATTSFLLKPRRWRVLLSQSLAYAIAGALFGALAIALTFVVGLPVFASRGFDFLLGGGDLAKLIVGGLLACALAAVLGVGIGALIRDQAAALVGTLVLLLLVFPVVASLSNVDLVTYGPLGTSGFLSGFDSTENTRLTVVGNGLAFLGYAVVFVGAAMLLATRRDT